MGAGMGGVAMGICPPCASLVSTARSFMLRRCVTGGTLARAVGNRVTSFFMSERRVSSWFSTLWSTAFAGLLPDKDSFDKCW